MSGKKHLLVWLILGVIVFLLTPAFVSQATIVNRVGAEEQMLRRAFGETDTDRMIQSANDNYQAWFLETGIIPAIGKREVSKEAQEHSRALFGGIVAGLSNETNAYLQSLGVNLWSALMRIEIIIKWLPFVLPFLIAGAIDGIVQRQVKAYSFGFFSPVLYSFALHSVIPVMVCPVFYLFAPLPLTPYFMPSWALIAIIPVMAVLANAQRIGGAR